MAAKKKSGTPAGGLLAGGLHDIPAVQADEQGMEAYGVRGMQSKEWRKTFKNQAAFERWLEENAGDVEVRGTRALESGR